MCAFEEMLGGMSSLNVGETSSILGVDHHGNTQGYPADKPFLVSDVVPNVHNHL